MLTFEQVEPLLRFYANKYINKNFEFWELINAVWERGAVQKLNDIRLAHKVIRCDMIDYMRSNDPDRRKVKFVSYDQRHILRDSFCGPDGQFEAVDNKDEVDFLLNHAELTPKKLSIIKLYFNGLTQKQIAERYNCHISNISYHIKTALQRLKTINRQKNECKSGA